MAPTVALRIMLVVLLHTYCEMPLKVEIKIFCISIPLLIEIRIAKRHKYS